VVSLASLLGAETKPGVAASTYPTNSILHGRDLKPKFFSQGMSGFSKLIAGKADQGNSNDLERGGKSTVFVWLV
jgi:hypothetical protein